jgi:hypothetical protein
MALAYDVRGVDRRARRVFPAGMTIAQLVQDFQSIPPPQAIRAVAFLAFAPVAGVVAFAVTVVGYCLFGWTSRELLGERADRL